MAKTKSRAWPLKYDVTFTPNAKEYFTGLRKSSQIFLSAKISDLEFSPQTQGVQGVKPLDKYWQLSLMGQHQVTYTINKKLRKVTIVSIAPVFP